MSAAVLAAFAIRSRSPARMPASSRASSPYAARLSLKSWRRLLKLIGTRPGGCGGRPFSRARRRERQYLIYVAGPRGEHKGAVKAERDAGTVRQSVGERG